MPGIIEFEFKPGQTVWVIQQLTSCDRQDNTSSVREGVVLQVRATLQITTPPVTGSPLVYDDVVYDVRIGALAGTVTFQPADVFPTLIAAINEYEDRLS